MKEFSLQLNAHHEYLVLIGLEIPNNDRELNEQLRAMSKHYLINPDTFVSRIEYVDPYERMSYLRRIWNNQTYFIHEKNSVDGTGFDNIIHNKLKDKKKINGFIVTIR